jgi:hypothetical protein
VDLTGVPHIFGDETVEAANRLRYTLVIGAGVDLTGRATKE